MASQGGRHARPYSEEAELRVGEYHYEPKHRKPSTGETVDELVRAAHESMITIKNFGESFKKFTR